MDVLGIKNVVFRRKYEIFLKIWINFQILL